MYAFTSGSEDAVVGGVTYTAPVGGASAATVATYFSTHAPVGFTVSSAEGGNVVFTSTMAQGDAADLKIEGTAPNTSLPSSTINLATGTASSNQTGADTLSNIENVTGSAGRDLITGSSLSNSIIGGAGSDTILAGDGNDWVLFDATDAVVDAGGGYAGAVIERLQDNSISYIRFNGAGSSNGRTLDSKLPFANKRAETWWRFREALDPTQAGGSKIALPPSQSLLADLTAPCLDAKALEQRGVIQIEPKEDLRGRLGRSPDEGDVAVMCWSEGAVAVKKAAFQHQDRPKFANVGRAHILRRR